MALCSPFPWTVSSQIPCLAALLAHPCLACPIQRPLACQFHTQLPSALLNVKQGPFLPRHCIHELPRQGHKGSVICFAAQPGSATHRADSTCYITASSSLTGGGNPSSRLHLKLTLLTHTPTFQLKCFIRLSSYSPHKDLDGSKMPSYRPEVTYLPPRRSAQFPLPPPASPQPW